MKNGGMYSIYGLGDAHSKDGHALQCDIYESNVIPIKITAGFL